MPKQEFGLQAGNARLKFMELVTTANGVYLIIPIPEMRMHLSLHYPNEKYSHFGAFLRVPGIDRNYTLELDEDILSVNNLLRKIESFGTLFEAGYSRALDDSEVMILPDSILNSFSGSSKRVYMDISSFLDWEWRIARAVGLSELVSRSSPTVAGISLEKENTAIIYDRDYGAFQFSLDEWMQTFDFGLFGNSFQNSITDALDEIEARRPDVLEKATPTEFIKEIQRMFVNARAYSRRVPRAVGGHGQLVCDEESARTT